MSNADNLPISRDGRFRVTRSDWDHNGSHEVDVLDTRPAEMWDALERGGPVPPEVLRAARRTARRADPHPEDVRWTRFEGVYMVAPSTPVYRFTVSRLAPECR